MKNELNKKKKVNSYSPHPNYQKKNAGRYRLDFDLHYPLPLPEYLMIETHDDEGQTKP